MTGVLLVDKPEGMTSAGAIRSLKGSLGRVKVGHVGTLDPFASGLLPLCLGEATKIAGHLLLERKTYRGRIQLGRTTDTLDATGRVVESAAVPELTSAAVEAVTRRFTGRQLQIPPMYSAIKRGGVPLYRLAREGIEVERAPREIEIAALVLRPVGATTLEFEVSCSKGTYVRVLAADLGRALGTVAHLEQLRRTRVGRFAVEAAVLPETLCSSAVADWPIVSIGDALQELRQFPLASSAVRTLRRGQQEPLGDLPAGRPGETALVLGGAGEVVAVVQVQGGPGVSGWRLLRLLGT